MESKRSARRRGVVLTPQGQQKLQVARRRAEVAENAGDRYTFEELSERTGVSLKTITKVLESRSTVDKSTLEVVFQAFEILLDRQDYRYPSEDSLSQKREILLEQTIDQVRLQVDWGEAPDVSLFYGRQAELVQLRQWIDTRNGQSRRLIAILGMGGMGKTALATKLLHEVIADRSHRG